MPAASLFSAHPALRGVALMIAAVGVFALLDATGKYLAQSYPVPGIVWARYAVNLGLLVGWFIARGLLRRMRTARIRARSISCRCSSRSARRRTATASRASTRASSPARSPWTPTPSHRPDTADSMRAAANPSSRRTRGDNLRGLRPA